MTVKVLVGGRMSGHLVRNLQVGTYLPIGLPQGDFIVPESTPGAVRSHRALRAALAEVPADAAGGSVTFRTAGTEVAAGGDATTPLLRIAEDAGLNPEHGCRMGICHTCDVPLVAGRVRDLRTSEVIDEPGRAVQICISGAAGDCEIDLTTSVKQEELQR